ncbi:LysR family transcriptional regulator [Sphingomonas sp. 67-36]|uniref:LysR family transcriptional regulator n=1 Tax=Sphingomonas sp. 67-36 TaxID=1895849 RepID=UPI002600A238|nr:LysR family transcriptional regulator [Sphingomonas sp. 67-36]
MKAFELELRHIRYVVTAARFGSFRKASSRLGVRESTISRQVRNLEDGLGSSLFLRKRSGVSLTQAGSIFVEHAQAALNEIDRAVGDVGTIGRGRSGTVRVGLSSPLATGFLGELLIRFCQQHEAVQLEFVEGTHTQLFEDLERGNLDIAFMAAPLDTGSLATKRLWTEDVFVVLSENDALTKKSGIAWSDIRLKQFLVTEAAPGRDIEAFVFRHLSSIGYSPRIQRDRVSSQTLMQLVAIGRGISIASQSVAETSFPGITYRKLEGCALPFSAVWSTENDNPPFRRLLSLTAGQAATA